MRTLIALYRAWPFRPHCNRSAGMHAWPCRVAAWSGLVPDWCKDLPGPIPD